MATDDARRANESSINETDVDRALTALRDGPSAVAASVWPPADLDLDQPGLYSWWVDADGAALLGAGLGEAVPPGLIYAGQAGATAWPSGKTGSATLASRIGGQHVRGGVRSSTFRLTLASILVGELGFTHLGPRKLTPMSETQLSAWITRHMSVLPYPFPNRDTLGDLENRVLAVLDPPLNLDGRPASAVRQRLSALRALLRGAPAGETPHGPPPDPSDHLPGEATPPVGGGVTLHDEIVAILHAHGPTLSTTEIAHLVNERGNYQKRDGSPVTDFQIHGRTKNYGQLFARDGTTVRLRT